MDSVPSEKWIDVGWLRNQLRKLTRWHYVFCFWFGMASACFAKTQWHRNASIGHQTKVTRNLVLVGSRSFFWVYAVVSRWALGSGVLRITGSITTVQIGSLNYQGNIFHMSLTFIHPRCSASQFH